MDKIKDSFVKRIELSLKRKLKNYVSMKRYPIVITKSQDVFKFPDNCKILLLRQDRIGDVLISVPAIRALRNRFPKAKIDILLSRKNHGVSNAIRNYVDKIRIYDKEIISIWRLIKNLRKENYSIIIDMFTSPSTTSSFLIKKIGTEYALGFDKDNRDSYTHVIDSINKEKVNIVPRTVELLLPFGIESLNLDFSLEYSISDEDKERIEKYLGVKINKRLGINLSGSSKAKFWGLNNYIDFIKKVKSEYSDMDIYIFTTIVNKAIANKIVKRTGTKLAKITNNIHEYACQLSTCDFIITPDTSAVHFASAFGIPSIVLYNKRADDATLNAWTSYNSKCVALTTNSGILFDISVNDVYEAFMQIMSE